MSDPIGSVTNTQAPAQVQATKGRDSPRESESRPVPTDTVQLSSAAQAALQESLETAAQTAKEAGAGDVQAKRLLAKHAAAKAEPVKTETATSVRV